jgi:hypothetical protein
MLHRREHIPYHFKPPSARIEPARTPWRSKLDTSRYFVFRGLGGDGEVAGDVPLDVEKREAGVAD